MQLLQPPGESQFENLHDQVDKQLSQLRLQVTEGGVQADQCTPKRSVTFSEQVQVCGGASANRTCSKTLDNSDEESDDDYHIYAHVEDKLVMAVKAGEFVELHQLAPRDTIEFPDEEKLQMVNRDGRQYWTPSENPPPKITNYPQWQAAFRVFSAIYQKEYPEKGVELLEYEHNIQNAARHYIWANVAKYDILFRRRMARHHNKKTQKSWAKKYCKAWDFELQEKLGKTYNLYPSSTPQSNTAQGPSTVATGTTDNFTPRKREICLVFNKTGKCKFGSKCHRDNRCLNCGKLGHGMVNCRKLKKDSNDK